MLSPVSRPNIALISAALDLQLVRLLRGAIHSNNILAPGGANEANIQQRPDLTPEPRIEARKVITPEPRIEPRLVFHPDPRIEPLPAQFAEPMQSESACPHTCPIEPPWKVLPWEQPLPVEPPAGSRVKLTRYRPDMARRGTMVDVLW